MKEEHKKQIEIIIQKFKETRDGSMYHEDFVELFLDNDSRPIIINILLKELGLIENLNGAGHLYKLTQNGWKFKSFSAFKEKEREKENREKIELDNLNSNTEVNKWLLKTRWLPHFLAGISIVVTLILGIITFKNDDEKQKLEKRLEILEKELESISKK